MRKIKKLKTILRRLGRVVVAYSGGLDSSFLLKAALDTLGRNNVLAVTARSETYPDSEYKEAKDIARALGVRHLTIRTSELRSTDFKSNPVNRCYYCKKELFSMLNEVRDKYRMNYVVDGTNLDDLKDIRYGSKAAKELGVRKPLLQAGITKAEIRKYSKALKLQTWDKPSFACLASRIPFNNRITKEGLDRIEKAEDYMRQLGFGQVRVRMHGGIARIEVSEKDLNLGMKLKNLIVNKLKKLGFIYVALDLEGYRTGSMHEAAKNWD
jgi:pyridinium-3,5-biscarboxylic acid mononucleotide sulfurtransferase